MDSGCAVKKKRGLVVDLNPEPSNPTPTTEDKHIYGP